MNINHKRTNVMTRFFSHNASNPASDDVSNCDLGDFLRTLATPEPIKDW